MGTFPKTVTSKLELDAKRGAGIQNMGRARSSGWLELLSWGGEMEGERREMGLER